MLVARHADAAPATEADDRGPSEFSATLDSFHPRASGTHHARGGRRGAGDRDEQDNAAPAERDATEVTTDPAARAAEAAEAPGVPKKPHDESGPDAPEQTAADDAVLTGAIPEHAPIRAPEASAPPIAIASVATLPTAGVADVPAQAAATAEPMPRHTNGALPAVGAAPSAATPFASPASSERTIERPTTGNPAAPARGAEPSASDTDTKRVLSTAGEATAATAPADGASIDAERPRSRSADAADSAARPRAPRGDAASKTAASDANTPVDAATPDLEDAGDGPRTAATGRRREDVAANTAAPGPPSADVPALAAATTKAPAASGAAEQQTTPTPTERTATEETAPPAATIVAAASSEDSGDAAVPDALAAVSERPRHASATATAAGARAVAADGEGMTVRRETGVGTMSPAALPGAHTDGDAPDGDAMSFADGGHAGNRGHTAPAATTTRRLIAPAALDAPPATSVDATAPTSDLEPRVSATNATDGGDAAPSSDRAASGTSIAGGTPLRAPTHAPWAERVVESVRLATVRGGGEMRLRLEPAGLGHIDVRISLTHDGVRATIVAEHDSTRALLDREQHLLHAALERSELRLAGFSVDVGFGSSGSAFREAEERAHVLGSSPRLAADSEVPPVHEMIAATAEPGRLSVRV